jgi:hypothetical protein
MLINNQFPERVIYNFLTVIYHLFWAWEFLGNKPLAVAFAASTRITSA